MCEDATLIRPRGDWNGEVEWVGRDALPPRDPSSSEFEPWQQL